MSKPSLRTRQWLASFTDDQLQAAWAAGFEDRVKSGRNKGMITVKASRLGDLILWEANRRGFRVETPRQYQ